VLKISLIGTAGVVVLARRRGLIGSTEVALRQLQGAGLWMSEQLIVKLAADDKAALAITPAPPTFPSQA
jgi:predicted nucleic acid-binding protein